MHGQVAVKGQLIFASTVVVGLTLIGPLKPNLGPNLRNAVKPGCEADGMLRIHVFYFRALTGSIIKIFVPDVQVSIFG